VDCLFGNAWGQTGFPHRLRGIFNELTQGHLVVTVAASSQRREDGGMSIAETNFTNSWGHVLLGTVPVRLMPVDSNGL